MKTSNDFRKPWQRSRYAQMLAILLGYSLPLAVFFVQLDAEKPTAKGYLFYAGVYTLIVIVVLLILLRFLCGEKPADLNIKKSTWWKDLLGGVVLVAITFTMKIALDPIIAQFFHRASDRESGFSSLFKMLAGNPWLLALFLGPILFIGVAGSEELTRVFFITRWKNISSSKLWLGIGVFLSAALFGLNHMAQGTAGIISVTLNALVMALWYLRFGRIFHLIVAHYLYDAIQIVVVVNLIWRGII